MTAQLKELKTNRTRSKEGMLEYLDDLKKQVEEDKVESLILIYSDEDALIKTQVIGDVQFTSVVGMMDTAKLSLQLSHFYADDDDDE